MDEDDTRRINQYPPQCLHNRLLESVLDQDGRKTDMMKCCECGALVPRPLPNPPPD